jgi:hypothetical protein
MEGAADTLGVGGSEIVGLGFRDGYEVLLVGSAWF